MPPIGYKCSGGGGSGSGPDAPANFTVTGVSTSTIELTWDDVADETFYVLERSTDGIVFVFYLEFAAGTTSYDDTPLPHSSTYYYRLRAVNDDGISATASGSSSTLVPVGPPVGGTLLGHWDAGDSLSITLVGSDVSEWYPQSGSAPLIAGTDKWVSGAAMPSISAAGLGGRDVITFAPSGPEELRYHAAYARYHTLANAQATYMLWRTFATIPGDWIFGADSFSAGPHALYISGGGGITPYLYGSTSLVSGTNVAVNAWNLTCLSWTGSGLSTNTISVDRSITTGTWSTVQTITTSEWYINAGGRSIQIAEIVHANAAQSSTNINDMCDYVNTKWGLSL